MSPTSLFRARLGITTNSTERLPGAILVGQEALPFRAGWSLLGAVNGCVCYRSLSAGWMQRRSA
eukprot:213007-Alexandrium_andersonii.AAC.1